MKEITRDSGGFSVAEVLLVITLLVILAAVILVGVSGVSATPAS